MKSNGYGRFVQTIVIKVAIADHIAVSRQLGITAERCSDDPSRMQFIWNRLSRQLRNDEDVVFDLRLELGDLADQVDWSIDWQASNY